MLAEALTSAVIGLEGAIEGVEVDTARGPAHGLPYFGIIGLPVAAVRQARERVGAGYIGSTPPSHHPDLTPILEPRT